MTYALNLENESEQSNWFIRIEPRLFCRSQYGVTWAVHSGNVYVTDWNFGYVYAGTYGTAAADDESSIASLVADGDFFYDHAAKKLYIYDSFNPNSITQWTFTFELYFSTTEQYAPRFPNSIESDTNPLTYWNPWITSQPSISSGSSDAMFGFIPSSASTIEIQCADGEILSILKTAVFNSAKVRIFHCLGDPLDYLNFTGIASGIISSYKLDGVKISFAVESIAASLDQTYPLTRFSNGTFPNLDPAAEDGGYLIRKVYGLKRGFIPVNIDWNATPSTTNNRDWVVSAGQSNKSTYTWDIIGAGTDTDTTEVDISQNGGNLMTVGDFVRLTDVNQTVEIISITGPAKFKIEHAAVGARGAGTIIRPFISQLVVIDRDGVTHKLKYLDHWTEQNFAGDTKGFTLIDNFEALIAGFPAIFDPNQDQIYCNVYGEKLVPYLFSEATDLGTVGSNGGSVDHPVQVIYDVLYPQEEPRGGIFFDEAGILAAYNDLGVSAAVGLSIPESVSDGEPTLKDIVESVCQSWFLRIHDSVYNTFSALTISQFKAAGTPDFELDDTEISNVEFEFDSKDFASDFEIAFNPVEIYETVNSFQFFKRISSVADGIRSAYGQTKKFSSDSVLTDSTNAQTIVDKFRTILGAQRFRISFVCHHKIHLAKIGDVIQISREKIPGVEFSEGVIDTVKGSIVSIQRSSGGVAVTIEVY